MNDVNTTVTSVLWLVGGFCLLHVLCAGIANRVLERSQWSRFINDLEQPDSTDDTGPR